jgi:hypothetical protein
VKNLLIIHLEEMNMDIEKIKELLGIKYDIKIDDLFDKLYEYRNSVHPDKHPKEMTEVYNKKFIEANNYLDILKDRISNEANKVENNKELVIYSNLICNRSLQFEIIDLQKKYNTTQEKLNSVIDENTKLNKDNVDTTKINVNEKQKNILQKYKFTKANSIFYGTSFGIATLIVILNQINLIKKIISPNFPFSEFSLNVIVILIYLYVIFSILINRYLDKNIELIIKRISTTQSKCEFIDYISDINKNDFFSEKDVINFIKKIFGKYKFINFLTKSWIYNTNDLLVDVCKDKLYNYLFSYRLIEVAWISKGVVTFKFKDESKWSNDKEIKDYLDMLFTS